MESLLDAVAAVRAIPTTWLEDTSMLYEVSKWMGELMGRWVLMLVLVLVLVMVLVVFFIIKFAGGGGGGGIMVVASEF